MVQLVRAIGRCNVVKVVCSIQMRELTKFGLDWLHMALAYLAGCSCYLASVAP